MNTIENLNFMIRQAYINRDIELENAFVLNISATDNRYEISVSDYSNNPCMSYNGIARVFDDAIKTAITFYRNKIQLEVIGNIHENPELLEGK